jgi:hypothetical protein
MKSNSNDFKVILQIDFQTKLNIGLSEQTYDFPKVYLNKTQARVKVECC